jgi:hypothetical protein
VLGCVRGYLGVRDRTTGAPITAHVTSRFVTQLDSDRADAHRRHEPFRARSGQTVARLYRDRVDVEMPGSHVHGSRKLIERFDLLQRARAHPSQRALSRYVDGDLDAAGQRSVEEHVRCCERCTRLLDSLAATVAALGALPPASSPEIADSVISALRAEGVGSLRGRHGDRPTLSVVGSSVEPSSAARLRARVRGALGFCCGRRQLAVTVPLALVVGVILSVVNQGGMLFEGQIDLGMCVMCVSDVFVPFVALNALLVAVVLLPVRSRR